MHMYASGHLCIAPLTDKGLGFGSTLLYEIKRRKYQYNNNAKIREAVKLKDRLSVPIIFLRILKKRRKFLECFGSCFQGGGGEGVEWGGVGAAALYLFYFFLAT